MGRNKKYETEEELREAVAERARRYYIKNKLKIQRRNRERYHKNKPSTDTDDTYYEPFDSDY